MAEVYWSGEQSMAPVSTVTTTVLVSLRSDLKTGLVRLGDGSLVKTVDSVLFLLLVVFWSASEIGF